MYELQTNNMIGLWDAAMMSIFFKHTQMCISNYTTFFLYLNILVQWCWRLPCCFLVCGSKIIQNCSCKDKTPQVTKQNRSYSIYSYYLLHGSSWCCRMLHSLQLVFTTFGGELFSCNWPLLSIFGRCQGKWPFCLWFTYFVSLHALESLLCK